MEEIEKMHAASNQQEEQKPRIPAIPSTAMSAEDLERKILQESQAKNQQSNGAASTPAQIPSLLVSHLKNSIHIFFTGKRYS